MNRQQKLKASFEYSNNEAGGVKNDKQFKGYGPYLLLVALSIHSIFAGISLGLSEGTNPTVEIFLAIALHKWAAALAIGIAFSKAGIAKGTAAKLLSVFSFTTPFGIILGIAISQADSPLAKGIFFSITVGTFLYIAASEVIVEEFASKKYKKTKFVAFLFGCALIAAVMSYDRD